MHAKVFRAVNWFGIAEVPRPRLRRGEVAIRAILTTIGGTNLHVVRGESAINPGLVLGHEPVGAIAWRSANQ